MQSFNACFAAKQGEALLSIFKPDTGLFSNAENGKNPDLENSDKIFVTGIINFPDFMIKTIDNFSIIDADGKNIHAIAEKKSIYSEFGDEINSMRIGFFVDKKMLEKGSLKLIWGEKIKSENKITEKITFYKGSMEEYRIFEVLKHSDTGPGQIYSASIDVVVDDKAQQYYLAYLLPMALLFLLLLIKKINSK